MVYHVHCLRPHWHLLCIFTPKNNNNLINVFDCRLGKVIDKRLHQSRINFIPCLGMGFVPCNAITLRIYHTQNELFVIATATYLRRIVAEICIRTYLPTAIHTSLVSLCVWMVFCTSENFIDVVWQIQFHTFLHNKCTLSRASNIYRFTFSNASQAQISSPHPHARLIRPETHWHARKNPSNNLFKHH